MISIWNRFHTKTNKCHLRYRRMYPVNELSNQAEINHKIEQMIKLQKYPQLNLHDTAEDYR